MATEYSNCVETNRAYFNATASSWSKEQWISDIHAQIFEHFTSSETVKWLGLEPNNGGKGAAERRLLDYACGSGIMTLSLKPLFRHCIGIDVSSAMVSEYKSKAQTYGFTMEEMQGVVGDLLADDVKPTDPLLDEDQLKNFDLIAISAALHHIHDPRGAMQKFVNRLRPGGVLVVVDSAADSPLLREEEKSCKDIYVGQRSVSSDGHDCYDHEGYERRHRHISGSEPSAPPTTIHKGFSKETILENFTAAGCINIEFVVADKLTNLPPGLGKINLFWARGFKPG